MLLLLFDMFQAGSLLEIDRKGYKMNQQQFLNSSNIMLQTLTTVIFGLLRGGGIHWTSCFSMCFSVLCFLAGAYYLELTNFSGFISQTKFPFQNGTNINGGSPYNKEPHDTTLLLLYTLTQIVSLTIMTLSFFVFTDWKKVCENRKNQWADRE